MPASPSNNSGDAALIHTLTSDQVYAVRRGEMKKVVKWLRKGSVDAQFTDGDTLLHKCVLFQQPDLMRELLRRGATIDVPNHDAGTPLMIACQLGAETEVELLCQHSADVNWRNYVGCTALMTAAAHEQPDVLSLLLQLNAEVNVQTTEGYTALMSAASKGANKCLRLLLKAGADISLQNSNGQTALGCACAKGHANTQLILQRAAQETGPTGGVSLKLRGASASSSSGASSDRSPRDVRLILPERSLHRAACTEERKTQRALFRASGLLARDMKE